jgi:hypothetical protein
MDLKAGKTTFMHSVLHIIPYKLSSLIIEQNALYYFRCEPHYLYEPMTTH